MQELYAVYKIAHKEHKKKENINKKIQNTQKAQSKND